MFIAVNTIQVENPEHMAGMFQKLSPQLKQFNGFLGFEVWKAENQLKAISRWQSKEDFERYINSDLFKSHHGGSSGPSMRNQAQVEYFEGESIV
ncbi:antibiotic biosynthesis monooxygenase [Ferviditalea candida]|uniref:Antibiotic biosynthesis monooxygenase n=1 Tax=Ferviditalea candida TaxID=3108399 RepID=A0ABU5ZL12_9BACL|nr:antibiotic biosynthesis monooxygenase [Paenibacillaceae bacterium T2]